MKFVAFWTGFHHGGSGELQFSLGHTPEEAVPKGLEAMEFAAFKRNPDGSPSDVKVFALTPVEVNHEKRKKE